MGEMTISEMAGELKESVSESIDACTLLQLVVVDRCKSSKVRDIDLAMLSTNQHMITMKYMPRCT